MGGSIGGLFLLVIKDILHRKIDKLGTHQPDEPKLIRFLFKPLAFP